jgi:hypothetical protein
MDLTTLSVSLQQLVQGAPQAKFTLGMVDLPGKGKIPALVSTLFGQRIYAGPSLAKKSITEIIAIKDKVIIQAFKADGHDTPALRMLVKSELQDAVEVTF